jgi:HK97 family phage major capsid protein
MWGRLYAGSKKNAVWLINTDCLSQLFTMGITLGVGGAPVYLPPGGASGSPYGSLFGRPVVEIEQASTLGTVGDISLVDLSEYILIEKGGIQNASSIHIAFTTDETAFRFVYRVDGQPLWNNTLTPENGTSNTVSPFVMLATRA